MKVAVIGASEEAIYAIQQAKEQGLEVIGIDGNPAAEGLKYVDKSYVMDIRDEQAVANQIADARIHGILPVPIGRYLTTIGTVNTMLNLPGITQEAAKRCTDKWYFHQLLETKGLRTIKSICGDKGQLYSNCEEVTFPSILKPRFGSGSRGISLVETKEQLLEQIEAIVDNEQYIVEDFVDGTEYGVDGAIIDGKMHLVLLREKILTPLPYRQAIAYISIDDQILQQQVMDFLSEITKILDLKQSLFHADLVRTKLGEWFVIELSGRPSGHRLSSEFTRLCTGCDMISEYIKYIKGTDARFETSYNKRYAIAYFDFSKVFVREVPQEQELRLSGIPLVAYNCCIQQGAYMEEVRDGTVMERGYFIVEGESSQVLAQYIQEVKEAFKIEKR